jgi:hypothetical protein
MWRMLKKGGVLIALVLLASCVTEKRRAKICATCPVHDTVTIKETISIVRDTFVVPEDSAFYYALLKCRDGKVIIDEILAQINGNRSRATVTIDNNRLKVRCDVDSLLQVIEHLKMERNVSKSGTKVVTVEAPKKKSWLAESRDFLLVLGLSVASLLILYWFLFKRKGAVETAP